MKKQLTTTQTETRTPYQIGWDAANEVLNTQTLTATAFMKMGNRNAQKFSRDVEDSGMYAIGWANAWDAQLA